MLKIVERAVASIPRRLILLVPPDTEVPTHFNNFDVNLARHRRLVGQIQRFRGAIYVQDGAVAREHLSADGLHQTPEDDTSWHLAVVDGHERVLACAWYRDHDTNVYFDRLRLKNCPLAFVPEWRDKLWKAVEGEIACARQHGLRYAEVGGWAVAAERRQSSDSLIVALAAYGLARIYGGAIGITTATVRHGSSSILCRIGGRPLEIEGATLPPYYDDRYRCMMEILRFDSRTPHARFGTFVELLHEQLAAVQVVTRPYWPMTKPHPRPSMVPPNAARSSAIRNSLSAA